MEKPTVKTDLFEVDKAECVKCGACVRDCFFGALRSGEDGFPVMKNPEKCMRCQHCLAICPKAAVSLDGKVPADSLPTEGLALPKADEVGNWMRTRRSTRRYQQRDVEPEKLDRILRTLANSPTGCNARSLTFTCYPSVASMTAFRTRFIKAIEEHRDGTKLLPRWLAVPALKMRRGGEDMFFRGAPGLLIVSSDETNPEVTTPTEDVVAACTNFELLAQANGLGTCWCGFLRLVQQEVPELLEKTSGIRRTTPFYAMMFGYPAVSYRRGVQRDDYATIVYK